MTHVENELTSQPACWTRAAELAATHGDALPAAGERVAIVGCGTSYFMAQSAAALREGSGQGETDAFAASEFPPTRTYDRVVALTRSGTTTEVLDLLRRTSTPSLAITADGTTPIVGAASQTLTLPFADERSVVQTRFATTTLALLRGVEDVLDVTLPLADLPDDARAWERGVDELADQDTEVAEYVRTLEEARDATDLPEASGDAIAREFERYLRRRGDRGEHGGR